MAEGRFKLGQLGKIERIIYEAKRLQTGLTGITAYVLKPGSVVGGSFALNEYSFAAFRGIYFFDYLTSDTDPEGTYTIVISSPNENNYRTVTKVDLFSTETSGVATTLGGLSFNLASPNISFELMRPSFWAEKSSFPGLGAETRLTTFSSSQNSKLFGVELLGPPSLSSSQNAKAFGVELLGPPNLSMDVEIFEEGT